MKNFFAKQEQLRKFASLAQIIIPDMVIGELREWYKRNLLSEKDKFAKSPLNNVLNHDLDTIDIETAIGKLLQGEAVSYDTISLSETNYLFKMKELALEKKPPFVSSEGTDKGFKDAYIYFTVLEYLQKVDDKYVFFVTNDALLRNAFNDNLSVHVVADYEEFVKKSVTALYDEYFVEQLQSEINQNITKDSIKDSWFNLNENQVIQINTDDNDYVVEIDSGEIVNHDLKSNCQGAVDSLVNSGSFTSTHSAITAIKQVLNFLSPDDIANIKQAFETNSQVGLISGDEDVAELIDKLSGDTDRIK